MTRILIVDDDRNLLRVLGDMLAGPGISIITAANAEAALVAIQSELLDLIITDLKMPRGSGMDVLAFSLKSNRSIPVIMVSAFGTIEAAVDAMKSGAYDFITKPFNPDELLQVVEKALGESKKNRELLTPYFDDVDVFASDIVGGTQAISDILSTAKKVALADSNVLISGETGVGKELVARAIHLASPRRQRPFVKVNCAAIPDALLESDLFGHERGAFTGAVINKPGRFELANGGTVFLDEIGEMPLNLQPKLLAVIQDKAFERVGGVKTVRIDVRIIAATNKDLAAACQKGTFRSDLFYRLNVVPISIPPLRERPADIAPLAEYFLHRLETKYGQKSGIPQEVMSAFIAHDWPGNIRELENVVERMFVLSEGAELNAGLIPAEIRPTVAPSVDAGFKSQTTALTRKAEKQMIESALMFVHQNRTQAAKKLGISRRTLQSKIKEYGL
jgi:two-component system response regulator AtoC